LRALAETNIQRAHKTYGQFMEFLTAIHASAWPPLYSSAFGTVQKRAIELAKENTERFFIFAKELVRAKDLHEVLTLETRYAQAEMEAYARQSQEIARLMAHTMPKLGRSISIP
jgi:hypothetical protein